MSHCNKIEDWIRIRKVIKQINTDTLINYGISRIINELFGDFKTLLLKYCLSKPETILPENTLKLLRNILKLQQINDINNDNNEDIDIELPLTLECLPTPILRKTTEYLCINDIKLFNQVSTSISISCLNELNYIDLCVINADKWILDKRISYDTYGFNTILKRIRLNGNITLNEYKDKLGELYWFYTWGPVQKIFDTQTINLSFPFYSLEDSHLNTKLHEVSIENKWNVIYLNKNSINYTCFDDEIKNQAILYPIKYFDIYKQEYYIMHYIRIKNKSNRDVKSILIKLIKNKLFKHYNYIFEWFTRIINNHNQSINDIFTFYVQRNNSHIKLFERHAKSWTFYWGDSIAFQLNVDNINNDIKNKLISAKKRFNDDRIPFYYDYRTFLDWESTKNECITTEMEYGIAL